MPAAAVIPAPIAYIKVVAVKKLVVGFWANLAGPLQKFFLFKKDFWSVVYWFPKRGVFKSLLSGERGVYAFLFSFD